MLNTVKTIKLGLDKEMNLGSKLLAMTISPGIAILANQKMVGMAKLITMLVHLSEKKTFVLLSYCMKYPQTEITPLPEITLLK